MSAVGMIDVTECDLAKLVRAAYSPSRQQGLGVFDPDGRSGDLPDDVVAGILERGKADPTCAISLDYLNGRSVKFHVMKIDGRLYIDNEWYDHSDGQLRALLETVGISGDAIARAREENRVYYEEAIAAARAVIEENGGTFVRLSGSNGTPEKVLDGLWAGRGGVFVMERPPTDSSSEIWRLSAR